ncbi:MAG: LCP family protein [Actinomycetota bacterium]|nr:LCP family protein [Actinomycetota bacterium]
MRDHGRRGWVPILLKALIVLVAVAVLIAGSAYVYIRNQLGKINRLDIPELQDDVAGGVMNVLLVGSDSRERTEGDIAAATGKGEAGTEGQRSDTIMVLHIDADRQKAAILSIPRDLYVPIAGTGYRDKINVAFAVGGAPQLIQTIQESLGISINHYVEVDFAGFERMVNTLGGVKVYVDAPARDEMTGLDIPVRGCVQLDGYQALAFVRSRYYESYENGVWVEDQSSDLGRIQRQQDFIRRVMKKAVSQGITNPITLNRMVQIGVDNVTLDRGMSTTDIVTVARRFRSLDPDTVEMFTLPTERAFRGDADVQILEEVEAQELIDKINGKAPLDSGPERTSDVRVRVLNGNGGDGTAGKAAFSLRQVGFVIGSTDTGDADSYAYRRTIIRHAPGKEAKAELLRSYLDAGAVLEEDRTLGTVDVALVIGADYTGVRPGPAAPSSSTPDASAAPADEPATNGPPPGPAC